MIIKSYSAPSVANALKVIKEELGNDAIILRTRHCPPEETALTGHRVEVTACVDEKSAAKKTAPAKEIPAAQNSASESIKKDADTTILPELPEPLEFASKLDKKIDLIIKSNRAGMIPSEIPPALKPLYLNLLDSDMPEEIVRQFIDDIAKKEVAEDKITGAALEMMTSLMNSIICPPLEIKAGMKIVFAGPSGAGKTAALAKMAARLATKENQKVTLASLDNLKVSSYEEIGGYADILGLPLDLTGVPESNHTDDTVLLIDTPSFRCHDKKISTLIKRLEKLNPDILFLVFSVCTRTSDLVDAVGLFDYLKPTHLLASHLDETGRWGGIITLNQYLEIPLALISRTPAGSGLLERPHAALLARRLLNLEDNQNDH